ncbi:hypothetical protein QVD17_11386 [Tagetes erecta]|uniref:Phytosulfokine n=1 Tax=Tagetes erecta TaxID=13708 RepID=A0AAD8P210_TARER|nr:hypothetical protein QVD17_11386 [Tagetes erecta]
MKHTFHCTVPFIFLIIIFFFFTHSSARFLHTKPGENPLVDLETINSFNDVMGVEDCENEDDECLKRRVLVDAHLDYIYTQHHKH